MLDVLFLSVHFSFHTTYLALDPALVLIHATMFG